VTVKLATAADLHELEVALATAFLDDPMVAWVYGEPDQQRRHQAAASSFFRPALAAGLRRGHTYLTRGVDGGVTGSAIWSPPDVAMLDDDEATRFGMAVHEHTGDEGLGRLMALGAYLESSSARNVPFYERLGFEVRWEERPAADGPTMRSMWRELR
jgi:hypothetical protein